MTPESTEAVTSLNGSNGIVTSFLGDQMYGFPILAVNDIIGPHSITRVPMSPPEVAGVLNLRGRIVTAIDMRRRFGKQPPEGEEEKSSISMVVIVDGEWYSLLFDRVGEVVPVSEVTIEPTPPTLRPEVAELSHGVAKLEDQLMVILDVKKILKIGETAGSRPDMLQ